MVLTIDGKTPEERIRERDAKAIAKKEYRLKMHYAWDTIDSYINDEFRLKNPLGLTGRKIGVFGEKEYKVEIRSRHGRSYYRL